MVCGVVCSGLIIADVFYSLFVVAPIWCGGLCWVLVLWCGSCVFLI